MLCKRLLNSTTVIIGCFLFNSLEANGETIKETCSGETKILFVGHSAFMYNDLPGIVDSLATKTGKSFFIDKFLESGQLLCDQIANPNLIEKINEQDWDYIVLAGFSSNAAFPDSHQVFIPPYRYVPLKESIITIKDIAESNYSGTKIVYCMT